MRIKEVKCDQFAGLNGRDYQFDNGLNLVIGANESGKSTLVDLLYHIFFQKVKIDGRSVEEFKEKYFPKKEGTYEGDIIDGTIKFETECGTYVLKKQWYKKNRKEGTVELTFPNGIKIADSDEIKKELDKILGYGKGVYDELVFASQRREKSILSSLLGGETSKNIGELSGILTNAVMETGGIDVDALEKELDDIKKKYEGRWDFAKDMPQGGENKRWKNEVGSILKEYYARKEVSTNQQNAEKAENEVEEINKKILAKKKERDDIADRRERFSQYRSQIAAQIANRNLYKVENEKLGNMQEALQDWPDIYEKKKRAAELKRELEDANIRELFEKISGMHAEKESWQDELEKIGAIESKDVESAKSIQGDIQKIEAQLRGMNMSAKITKFGDVEVQVKSLVSGVDIELTGERLDVTEALEICVPGVVAVQLSPKGLDVDSLEAELEENRRELRRILEFCHVDSVERLGEMQQKADELSGKIADKRREIKTALGKKWTWDKLEVEAKKLSPDGRTAETISADIEKLCEEDSVDTFIGRMQGMIDKYVKEYETLEKLAKDFKSKKKTVGDLFNQVKSSETIPEEFAGIDDTEKYDEELGKKLKDIEEKGDNSIEGLRRKLSNAERNLGDKSAEEYYEEYLQAEEKLQSLKEEYRRWVHIQEVILRVKNKFKGNPLEDIEQNFSRYLELLSDGNLALHSIDEKSLGSSITSGTNRLNADILSDGTKDTIELAFRLAVLNHLFPEGGCVAVFDDPFTDMDPRRTAQACKLIEEFAQNNQVIFVSCDEKYLDYMEGNHIQVSR